jgi:uncharacterized ferritin-like protein (DUF455 family)
MQDLAAGAHLVLTTGAGKSAVAHAVAAAWHQGLAIGTLGGAPDRPTRPRRPEVRSGGSMPRRRVTRGVAGRVALLHAVAHIEFNAIDLAFDMVLRFGAGMPRAFLDDWIGVGREEAVHFDLLAQRLHSLGAAYGDLPAHDGLWQAALDTADDLCARLAIVPLVLEARGLDVAPQMIERLLTVDDPESAAILQRIHDDEIGHVAIGQRWFEAETTARGLDPGTTWSHLVSTRFHGQLKPPFNTPSRTRAGLPEAWYQPLALSPG